MANDQMSPYRRGLYSFTQTKVQELKAVRCPFCECMCSGVDLQHPAIIQIDKTEFFWRCSETNLGRVMARVIWGTIEVIV